MLSADKLQILSEFARYVDAYPAVRELVVAASSLGEVEMLAFRYGFPDINEDLLKEAACLLSSHHWVWKENGQRWSDHVFSMALALTLQEGTHGVELCRIAEDTHFSDAEASRFYSYAQHNHNIQIQLKNASSISEVVAIVRSYGFRLRSTDFILRKHEWRDHFFPWAGFSTNKVRHFMHSLEPGVDHQ
ncbi:Nif11-like leader peptide family natural product precursor [Synechococcus sp. BA-132 BA5]|uniref:Nif11-like leader peptide family natural product precursor n=1 Tax=Synechococcus sp. BA-132 BA5 TaxID=3110252 RepID=UPI002B221821|nr:Nif11-like leader peptide family natural product precursor [Synechococcus sp. BA-132 BA5]MEA5416970.1 Nif11-like leader peptide family natural product precursor [Synechococcus sp. BA-132 BA5]